MLKAPRPADGVAIVTGATGGLGYQTALGLARAGFEVLVTGRDIKRGERAIAGIKGEIPSARLHFAMLDVASLASVREFATVTPGPVAVLVNNAGVMALPQRALTEDGFERQIGTNYLGHFALTGLLLDRLRGGRVVNVSSLAHRRGRIMFDDFQSAAKYDPWVAYQQSKLAMLMFGLELQKRSVASDWGITSVTAHPGWSATQIVLNGPGGGKPALRERIMQAAFSALGQSAAAGALPELYAALDPGARPGGYYGPCCLMETRGHVTPSKIMPQARNEPARTRLWALSESLTGVSYPAAATLAVPNRA